MSISENTFTNLSDADAILDGVEPWTSSDDTVQQEALEWATVYMKDVYLIPSNNFESTDNQTLKNANALLANKHISKNLFESEKSSKPQKGLLKSRVKGDVVESEKTYDAYVANSHEDPFPDITAMMSVAGFKKKQGSGISSAPLIRR